MFESRLTQLLSDCAITRTGPPLRSFSERLGDLVDLSGSIQLSRLPETLKAISFTPSEISTETIKADFSRSRAALVRGIAQRFAPSRGQSWGRLPTPQQFYAHLKTTGLLTFGPGHAKISMHAYDPYQQFYVRQRKELDAEVKNLRARFRKAISGISPALARLATLDQTLEGILAPRITLLFNKMPILLEKRFYSSLNGHWSELPNTPGTENLHVWMAPGGWIANFCREMREALLTEIEVRLKPVLGMIESLPPHGGALHTMDKRKEV